jgi:hypothetical protein
VSAREERQANGVGIFLQSGLGNLLGGLVQTCVDDLETMVSEGAGDGLGTSVMTI